MIVGGMELPETALEFGDQVIYLILLEIPPEAMVYYLFPLANTLCSSVKLVANNCDLWDSIWL